MSRGAVIVVILRVVDGRAARAPSGDTRRHRGAAVAHAFTAPPMLRNGDSAVTRAGDNASCSTGRAISGITVMIAPAEDGWHARSTPGRSRWRGSLGARPTTARLGPTCRAGVDRVTLGDSRTMADVVEELRERSGLPVIGAFLFGDSTQLQDALLDLVRGET